jgi:hypothetical protein
MIRAGILTTALALVSAMPALAQTSVSGDWDVTVTSPQGTNTVKVTLTQDGEKVKGLFKTQMGELPFEGTLTGTDLKFAYTLPFQGQMIDITMTGRVEGDAINGTANFGGMAEGQWTAKRAPAAAVTNGAAPAAAPPAAASTTPSAAAAGATGQWDVLFKTPQGDFPASATLKDESGKLSGTFASQIGETPVTGTLAGKALKLSMTSQTPQGTMEVTLTGDVDGDQIVNGRAEVSGMGSFEFTAKRRQ